MKNWTTYDDLLEVEGSILRILLSFSTKIRQYTLRYYISNKQK